MKEIPHASHSIRMRGVESHITTMLGPKAYEIFETMILARASERAIQRALKQFRPTLQRPTVHKWVLRFWEQQTMEHKSQSLQEDI